MRKRFWGGLVAVVVVVGFMVAQRHVLIRTLLEQSIRIATGYNVSIGDQRLGWSHGAFLNVHVAHAGQPVLDAARIDLYYALRDLLPGSGHRFGLHAITIDAPELTLVRNTDGSYNVALPSSGAPGGVPGRVDPVPLTFTVRVRNGGATLIDQTQFARDRHAQRVRDIAADATIDSAGRTHYTVTGAFEDVTPEPFSATGTVDVVRGYAMHRLRARAVPLRAIGNFIINSPAARVLAGTAHDVDARAYAFDVSPAQSPAYHVGARMDVSDAQLYITDLAKPVDDIRGRLQVVDDVFFTNGLRATLAGIPVRVDGGIFDFAHPQFRFGVSGAGDLAQLRTALSFAKTEPVAGDARVGLLIQGPVASPMLVAGGSAPAMRYNGLPLTNVHARLALDNGVVIISPLRATYGGIATQARGTLTLGTHLVSEIAVHAGTPSDRVPYLNEVLAREPIVADAVLRGTDGAFGARGSLASGRDARRAGALFHFDPNGIAEVAPFYVNAGDGSVAGRYRLDRKDGTSAFWLLGENLALHAPAAPTFPGLSIPQVPPIAGALHYAAVAGGGSGANVVLAGRGSLGTVTISGVHFNALEATFSGNLADASINAVHADGPWGSFDGSGSFSPNALAARGSFDGTLQGLEPFLGGIPARGALSGPVALALRGDGVVVQARDVRFRNARIGGVAIESASGTLGVEHGLLRVYSANARVAGGHVVAAGTYGTTHRAAAADAVQLVGVGMHADELRGLGLPLDAGNVAVAGGVAASASTIPAFDGVVAVRNGRAQGYPVRGSVAVALHGTTADIAHGVAALGTSYAVVNGSVGRLGTHAPVYALHAAVPAADIANALTTLHLPTYETQGVYNADLAITGSGAAPVVSGPIGVPGGSVNGLPFVDAGARIVADPSGVTARYASARVGSTDLRFSAIARRDETAVSIHAPHATLSDFNDFFDTGDTLDGVGAVAFSLIAGSNRVATSGDINVKGLRYRSLPIGDTVADWSSRSGTATGSLAVGGAQGTLRADGSIAFAREKTLPAIVADSFYDVGGKLDDVDLSTWLPAFGYPTVPLLGRVKGSAHLRGRYPALAVTGDATLSDGSFARLPIEKLTASVRSQGDRIVLRDATLAASNLSATANGSLSLAKAAPLDLSVHATTDDLAKLIAQLTKTSVDVKGTFETSAKIGGTFAAPTFAAAFDASDVAAYDVRVPLLFGEVRLHGNNLELRNAGAQFARGSVALAGTLPLELQPFEVATDRPVSFDLQLQDVDPGTLDAFFKRDTKLGGDLNGHVGISGTLQSPRIYGQVQVTNGSYVSDLERIGISNTVATLTFDRTSARLDGFSAQMGRGRLTASGNIAFARGFGALGDVNYTIAAVAHGAQLDLPAYGSGTLDGTVAFTRTPPGLARLSGDVAVSDAVIPFGAFLGAQQSSGHGPSTIAGIPIDMGFDLGVAAGRNVRVRGGGFGAGLDIGATGAARLGGTLSAPTLRGTFTSTGGTLTYFDRAFRVQSGTVAFDPVDGVLPTLKATGFTHVANPDPDLARNPYGSADITLRVEGPLDHLKFSFDSNPPGYSREQIIALLAPFGGFASSIAFDPITGEPAKAPGQLPGAPAPAAGQLPGLAVRQVNGTLTVGQEAFNILNAQFTAGLLAPLETALGAGLGLSNLNLTVDYYGNVGVNVRRQIGKFVNAVYSTTFGLENRQSFGLEYAPSDATAAQLSAFFVTGPQRLFQTPYAPTGNLRLTAGQALQGSSGFTFTLQRLFR